MGSLLLSPGPWCTKFCLCPSRVYIPVLCKFWHLYGGVNGDLLQEGLCHTQVCFIQGPCPCGSPLLTHTTTGDTQTQFCLSLCGVPESWCAQSLFEPSEHLWKEWGLILNMNSSLLPSCWGLFALGRGVSPYSCSSANRLTGVSQETYWGFTRVKDWLFTLFLLLLLFERAHRSLIVNALTGAHQSLVSGNANRNLVVGIQPKAHFFLPHEIKTTGWLLTSNLQLIYLLSHW